MSAAAISMPGVQKPHCAALRATKAILQVATSPLSDRPSMVVDLRAVEARRQHQAAAHDLAVHAHRAGAADAVLAAGMGAGQAEIEAQEVDQVRRGSTLRVTRSPLTVSVMSTRALMRRPPSRAGSG
jgi:hypothetical protein